MTSIYDQHDKAFSTVQAYAIIKDGVYIGKIAFKFPKDGAGRLTVFVHEHGYEMVKGTASGCGYDKRGASLHKAGTVALNNEGTKGSALYQAVAACTYNGEWHNELRKLGYIVASVI